jgi:hypothetical protein
MKLLDGIVDRILNRLQPVIEKQLTELRADAMTQLTEVRTEAMTMLANELPKIAGAVAELAITTVFDHTHIDEAANNVGDIITGILGRLPFLNVITAKKDG